MIHPKKWRRARRRAERQQALDHILQLLHKTKPSTLGRISRATGLSIEEVEGIVNHLVRKGQVAPLATDETVFELTPDGRSSAAESTSLR